MVTSRYVRPRGPYVKTGEIRVFSQLYLSDYPDQFKSTLDGQEGKKSEGNIRYKHNRHHRRLRLPLNELIAPALLHPFKAARQIHRELFYPVGGGYRRTLSHPQHRPLQVIRRHTTDELAGTFVDSQRERGQCSSIQFRCLQRRYTISTSSILHK